jgi:hypothetical protein
VDNAELFSHTFDPRVDEDGYTYGLNMGMVGFGSDNSRSIFDNIKVQVLPPEITFEGIEDFSDDVSDLVFVPEVSDWTINEARYQGSPPIDSETAISLVDLGLGHGLEISSILELEATMSTQSMGGVIFDYYGPKDFKFVAIISETNQVAIGHHTAKRGWSFDAVTEKDIDAGKDYTLFVSLKGRTVSVSLDGYVVLGHAFNGAVIDGDFGLLSKDGSSSFNEVIVKTDDPAFSDPGGGNNLMAAVASQEPYIAMSTLTYDDLTPIIEEAIDRWEEVSSIDNAGLELLNDVTFQIVDLPGLALAQASSDKVFVDITAAGHDWFIDTTPSDEMEFGLQLFSSELWAIPSSEAYGRMDLLTVVMHELGHVLGFEDLDSEVYAHDLMSETLTTGTRRIPVESADNKTEIKSERLVIMDSMDSIDKTINRRKLLRFFDRHRRNRWLPNFLLDAGEDDNHSDPNSTIQIVIPKERIKTNLIKGHSYDP